MGFAGIHQPTVVDFQHVIDGLDILHIGRTAMDAENDLGVDAVAFYFLDVQM